MRWSIALLVLAAAGAGGFVAYRKFAGHEFQIGDYHFRIPRIAEPRAMHVIYLERHGAVVTGGGDDAPRNVSSVVAGAKKTSITVPPFRGGDAAWKSFVSCVQAKFAPFDVTVTDVRPEKPGYVFTVVGGTPRLLGYDSSVKGLAPFSGDAIPDPVVFVFSAALDESVRPMCETAAMEIGHTYGLDHEYLCKDPMTYLTSCGAKSFQNVDAPCGELRKRPCEPGGKPTQNSVARLLAVLGAKK